MIRPHTLAAMSFLCIVTTILAAAAANAQAPATEPAKAAPVPAVVAAPVKAAPVVAPAPARSAPIPAPAAKAVAPATNPAKPVVSTGYKYDKAGTIARVEVYLSQLSTIKARFNQVAPDGSVQTGTFFLKRPGKMRWEYDPPTPVLLVSNGSTITYYDSDLGQVNYIDINDTLAGFLTRNDIQLDNAATKVTKFEAATDVIRITVVDATKPTEGALTLEFVDRPLQLKFMTVSDAAGAETHVQLQGAEYGSALDNSLFVFKDPRGVVPRKR